MAEQLGCAEALLLSGLYEEAAQKARVVFEGDSNHVSEKQLLRAFALRMMALYEDKRCVQRSVDVRRWCPQRVDCVDEWIVGSVEQN